MKMRARCETGHAEEAEQVLQVRRHGVGRLLLDAAVSRERARGRSTLLVATAAADVDNLRFYQRAGWNADDLATYRARFGGFGRMIHRLPDSFRRIEDGDGPPLCLLSHIDVASAEAARWSFEQARDLLL